MFDGPIRGGTRGGQGEFKWSDVSADKDRENYLGHSINAPTGRWQKNKDVHWYNRDLKATEAERLEEIRKVKEAEEDALAVALGFKPAVRPAPGTEPTVVEDGGVTIPEDPALLAAKEERRRRKEERRKRKDEKREQKELRRLQRLERGSAKGVIEEKAKFGDDKYDTSRRRLRHTSVTRSLSRSRSPRRPSRQSEGRIVSRSPSRGYRNQDARPVERDRYGQRSRIDKPPYDSDYERGRGRDRW